jgi:hypothetical protein
MNTTKVLATKILSVAALATAFALVPAAKAQAFGVGVQFGQPAYTHVDPRYPVARYNDRDRYEFERRQEFLRQQAWQRDHDRRYDDHRRFDDHHRW